MFGLFIASLIVTCTQLIKEACEPTIPAKNWGNKKLYHEDMMNGVSIEQRMKNLKNEKYVLMETYQKPHRALDGKIVIENNLSYKEDVKKYGAYQAHKWLKQGKYNLPQDELRKEHGRIKKDFEYLYSLL